MQARQGRPACSAGALGGAWREALPVRLPCQAPAVLPDLLCLLCLLCRLTRKLRCR